MVFGLVGHKWIETSLLDVQARFPIECVSTFSQFLINKVAKNLDMIINTVAVISEEFVKMAACRCSLRIAEFVKNELVPLFCDHL